MTIKDCDVTTARVARHAAFGVSLFVFSVSIIPLSGELFVSIDLFVRSRGLFMKMSTISTSKQLFVNPIEAQSLLSQDSCS